RARRLALGHGPGQLTVEVVPGVPAAMAAAALLGAPLAHDFACISLSDRLTPWELIERRLDLTAQADLVIALYNPRSKGRDWQYARALELVAKHRAPGCPVGVVRRATRQGQSVALHDMASAQAAEVDMQTIVIIGNSQSFTHAGRMVTPRGYVGKYGDAAQARR
ncbi:MAG: precorrin-3B C(17)-methyltransferase, partial [Desulfovibrio sp.]|nr:precorrin-3B C(17)-methyltransferase [Desulfovibrio sp.]